MWVPALVVAAVVEVVQRVALLPPLLQRTISAMHQGLLVEALPLLKPSPLDPRHYCLRRCHWINAVPQPRSLPEPCLHRRFLRCPPWTVLRPHPPCPPAMRPHPPSPRVVPPPLLLVEWRLHHRSGWHPPPQWGKPPLPLPLVGLLPAPLHLLWVEPRYPLLPLVGLLLDPLLPLVGLHHRRHPWEVRLSRLLQ